MKIDLLDVDKFIEANECLEVTNPVYFNAGSVPTEDGLFSTSIFGELGSKERAELFGYINLNSKFFNPIIYNLLHSIDRKTKDIVSGNMFVSLDEKGFIVENEKTGTTGIDFYYKNWNKIKFKATASETRKTKLGILANTNKSLVFVDKWIIMPALLRDMSGGGSSNRSVDIINETYSKIIRLARGLKGSSFGFITNNTKYQIQEALSSIYEKLVLNDLSGKKGLFRRSLMGKSIDYATRSVISAPNMNANKYDDLEIPFGYTGIPLSQLIVLFYPFFTKYIRDFVEMNKDAFANIPYKDEIIHIDNVEEQFSDNNINKLLDNYIKNIDGRFDRIRMQNREDKQYYVVKIFNEDLGRDFTLTDLLYLAAVDICEDKHVYVTRYPMDGFLNIYPSKIKILTTNTTITVTLQDRLLKNYPVVYPDYPNEYVFVDTCRINNSYTIATGADEYMASMESFTFRFFSIPKIIKRKKVYST